MTDVLSQPPAIPGPAITGATRLFAVLGDPVTQVQAPALLNPLFARRGIDAVLVPVQVQAENFTATIRGLMRIGNLDGMLITVPHKIAAAGIADECSPVAQISGSANALRPGPGGRWYADNFDGAGFVSGLASSGYAVPGRRVSLVGAGGAGSSIAAGVLVAGAAHLAIFDNDSERLDSLVGHLQLCWPDRVSAVPSPALRDVDIAVNATPLGLRPEDPLPFPPDALPRDCVVADIVMKPAQTTLLRVASAAGRLVHPGIHMLTHQLDSYCVFFGLAPAARLPRRPAR
jgi:shikimate dehydrogenase